MEQGVATNLFVEVESSEVDGTGAMSALSAVELLLTEVGSPLDCAEITRRILKRRIWISHGKTPAATINAQIAVDIKKHGDKSRFQRTAPSVFGLRSWGLPEYERVAQSSAVKKKVLQGNVEKPSVVSLSLSHQIQRHNKEVSKALHERLLSMDPTSFEVLVGELLTAIGFEEVEVTTRSADGGIDVRGTLVVGEVIRTKMAVQVKRWRSNVQAPIVQQVRGSLGTHDQGLIITTSDFSSGAREEARRSNAIPVALMGGEQLVRLLLENNLGVRRTQHDLFELEKLE